MKERAFTQLLLVPGLMDEKAGQAERDAVRAAENDMRCVPAGTGCIPMADILRIMQESGYPGWYTIEQYGSRNMLSDSQESINNIRTLLNGLKK